MKLVIIGAGQHAGVVIDAVHRRGEHRIVAVLDDTVQPGEVRHGYEVKGRISDVQRFLGHNCFIAIGSNNDRLVVWSNLRKHDPNYVNVIHPKACIAAPQRCVGTFFASGCHVGPNATVGSFAIVNTMANLDHDSHLGEFSHMAPGVVTGGRVHISDLCFIGLGAMIRDGSSIGRKSTIGMGSVVIGDIGDNCVAYGNPAIVK